MRFNDLFMSCSSAHSVRRVLFTIHARYIIYYRPTLFIYLAAEPMRRQYVTKRTAECPLLLLHAF